MIPIEALAPHEVAALRRVDATDPGFSKQVRKAKRARRCSAG